MTNNRLFLNCWTQALRYLIVNPNDTAIQNIAINATKINGPLNNWIGKKHNWHNANNAINPIGLLNFSSCIPNFSVTNCPKPKLMAYKKSMAANKNTTIDHLPMDIYLNEFE